MTATRRPGVHPNDALIRIEQFAASLTHRHSSETDQRIRSLLNDDGQWSLVARLSAFDRAHHLRVHDSLIAWGFNDPDLLRAALLHDIGKADGARQVRLWHRVLRVVGRRCAPSIWTHMAGRWSGLYLVEHHARLGAEAARSAGAPARCCELIQRHEETVPTGDELLDALIEADQAATR